MKERVPWWTRIAAKLVLSRLPVAYALWRKLHLFAHGAMDQTDYAVRVFQQHFAQSGLAVGEEFVGLELGPGDSLASAVIAAAYGATHVHLVDADAFATTDLAVYRRIAQHLLTQRLKSPNLDGVSDLHGLLTACRASYGTLGLASLRMIPTASVDFIWSHAVLEHIRRREFLDFMRETRRILKNDGVCSHEIDLRDHLGGALNNLRIPSRWWEADWMARSGFYTNRLRSSEMIRAFESAGFSTSIVAMKRWQSIPTPRHALAEEFQGLDAEELLVQVFDVVLNPV
jgi:SAM-dependent methyltransferase